MPEQRLKKTREAYQEPAFWCDEWHHVIAPDGKSCYCDEYQFATLGIKTIEEPVSLRSFEWSKVMTVETDESIETGLEPTAETPWAV